MEVTHIERDQDIGFLFNGLSQNGQVFGMRHTCMGMDGGSSRIVHNDQARSEDLLEKR